MDQRRREKGGLWAWPILTRKNWPSGMRQLVRVISVVGQAGPPQCCFSFWPPGPLCSPDWEQGQETGQCQGCLAYPVSGIVI